MHTPMRLAGAAVAFALITAPASAQNMSLRGPPWAQPLLATDVIATTGGRAALAAEGISVAARVTIAPPQGGVARVIRYEARDDAALLAVRRFTGHPTTGWWLWGSDAPRVDAVAAPARAEINALVRAAMTVSAINAPATDGSCRGEQAFLELVSDGRSAIATRACVVATDPVGRLALRLSEAAGSRTEQELADAAMEEVMAADRAFAAKAQAEGVPAAFAEYAASDAIMLSSAGEPTVGADAVRARFADWPEGARLQWTPQTARVAARGDMAWTWGESVFTAADGARTTGRYVSIWSRDYDGNWRFAFDAPVQ